MKTKTLDRSVPRRPSWLGWLPLVLVVLALLAASAGPAAACPVCYGNAEGQVIDGAKASVAFMGILVYAVMGGGVAMVVVSRRRALRGDDDPRDLAANDPREEG